MKFLSAKGCDSCGSYVIAKFNTICHNKLTIYNLSKGNIKFFDFKPGSYHFINDIRFYGVWEYICLKLKYILLHCFFSSNYNCFYCNANHLFLVCWKSLFLHLMNNNINKVSRKEMILNILLFWKWYLVKELYVQFASC